MIHDAECRRCGRSFAPDTRHLRAETEMYPPESEDDALGESFDLCPECTRDFRGWLDE